MVSAPSSPVKLISIVVPCYNEEEVFPLLRAALEKLGDELAPTYRTEFVLVDDGSRDTTWEKIQSFSADDARVRGIAFSRNFGHQPALTCGYDLASGDAIVCLDADLQDPPEVIHELIAKWEEGTDVVFAIRHARDGESKFKLFTAALFYRLIRFLGAKEVKADSGDFRLMSRRSLDALKGMREQHRFIRGMVGWVGFETAEVLYHRKERAAGKTSYPLSKMIKFALDATVSFSTSPLRLAFVGAFLVALVFLVYLAYSLVLWGFFDDVVFEKGWTSLLLSIMAFGIVNLFCLGILGEYVGRIFEQIKARPLYLVRDDTGVAPARPIHESASDDVRSVQAGP